jgi:hypothetical protein
LRNSHLLVIDPSSNLSSIKKIRHFVSHEYWEYTCPRPSDEVLAQVKEESAKKRKTKMTAPKAAATKSVATTAPKKRARVSKVIATESVATATPKKRARRPMATASKAKSMTATKRDSDDTDTYSVFNDNCSSFFIVMLL